MHERLSAGSIVGGYVGDHCPPFAGSDKTCDLSNFGKFSIEALSGHVCEESPDPNFVVGSARVCGVCDCLGKKACWEGFRGCLRCGRCCCCWKLMIGLHRNAQGKNAMCEVFPLFLGLLMQCLDFFPQLLRIFVDGLLETCDGGVDFLKFLDHATLHVQ
jgi:hypothetical protein